MGLIADKHPAMYGVLRTAPLYHGKGMQSYLCMMAVRLMEMRRPLKSTGSIYLPCDLFARADHSDNLHCCARSATARKATGPRNIRLPV